MKIEVKDSSKRDPYAYVYVDGKLVAALTYIGNDECVIVFSNGILHDMVLFGLYKAMKQQKRQS